MAKLKAEYDYVIAGSGLGGLLCAYFLCEEGYSVCVLEKNAQIGGNLQTFIRDKTKFDSGVHYIGGVEKGQALYPYLKYFDLLDNIDLEKLDEDGFDRISFDGDENLYPHGMGYENFIIQLLKYFPKEEEGIRKYCDAIKKVCANFGLYNIFKSQKEGEKLGEFGVNAKTHIESFTSDKKLQSVLAGTNMLYAGDGDTSPFYIHALISDSYINSAYKLKHSDQISKQLRKRIMALGGQVIINAEVVRFVNTPQVVESVVLADGRSVKGKNFISNIHPTLTFKLLDTTGLRKIGVNRMLNLKNTTSCFVVYIKLKPNTRKFNNFNRYHYFQEDVWTVHKYTADNWIKGLAFFNSRDKTTDEYASSLTIMAYMTYEEVKKWEGTFNTTLNESKRDDEYVQFKEDKTQEVLKYASKVYPEIYECIDSYYSATPLTQRDYTGAAEGAIYGISHDYNAPLSSLISPFTKLKNLFLTGENIILHGVLGVTIGAVVTCQYMLGKEYVIDKIKAKLDKD